MKNYIIYMCRIVSIYFATNLLTAGIDKWSINFIVALACVAAFEYILVYAGKRYFYEGKKTADGIVFAVFMAISFLGTAYYMYGNPQKVANKIASNAALIDSTKKSIESFDVQIKNLTAKGVATASQKFVDLKIQKETELNVLLKQDQDLETTIVEFLLSGAEFIGYKGDSSRVILVYGLIRAFLLEFVGFYLMFSATRKNKTASPALSKSDFVGGFFNAKKS